MNKSKVEHYDDNQDHKEEADSPALISIQNQINITDRDLRIV